MEERILVMQGRLIGDNQIKACMLMNDPEKQTRISIILTLTQEQKLFCPLKEEVRRPRKYFFI